MSKIGTQLEETRDFEHWTPVQKLRSKLQSGNDSQIKIEQIIECSNYDLLNTCEELLAFEKYDLFQKLKKKKQIPEATLIECSATRQLYRGYLQAKKGMTSKFGKTGQKLSNKKQFNFQNLEEERARQKKRKIIKGIIFLIVLVLSTGLLFKYRQQILQIFKLILNMK